MPRRLEDVSPLRYFPWRENTGVTHRAWSVGMGYDSIVYTHCDVTMRHGLRDGQGIGNAVITCIRCMAKPP